MIITMTQTRRGTEDGFTLKRYMKGETYDVLPSLARAFINQGWAVVEREAA